MKATWRILLKMAMKDKAEDLDQIISIAPKDLDLDRKFDDGYGGSEGKPFTIWTHNRVYFPVVYDGAEWVDSVPRNPRGEITKHCGGQ